MYGNHSAVEISTGFDRSGGSGLTMTNVNTRHAATERISAT
jgi:hypothetical protein